MKVLVGDPDTQLVAVLSEVLSRAGFVVLTAGDGPQALAAWRAEWPDLVLLEDQRLPGLAGFALTRAIRQHGARMPVILMSDKPSEAAMVRGLESGADAYLAKPIRLRQLLARIQALLRRAATVQGPTAASDVCLRGWRLDLTTCTVSLPAGQVVRLTPLEYRLLYVLLVNVGQVVPYAHLIQASWDSSDQGSPHLLKTHVVHVRRKLGLAARGPHAIQAVPGLGYRLVLPQAEVLRVPDDA
jgi:DNA-binding response OmpR family regulator